MHNARKIELLLSGHFYLEFAISFGSKNQMVHLKRQKVSSFTSHPQIC